VVIGAGVPYTRLIDELGADLPGLATRRGRSARRRSATAARSAANLGSASPAGDTHPVLLALDATVEADLGTRARGSIPIDDFYSG